MRTLEELGIGRPSTYASILGTILDRGYVFKRGTALVPAFLAFSVVGLLEQHFGQLVDYDFTARMEDDLDRIAAGDEHRVEWLGRFYFGDGDGGGGLHELVSDLGAIDAREINSLEIGDGIVLRVGRYGPYLERDGQRASVPEELAPDELTVERAEELLAQPSGDRELGIDPETGRAVAARTGRYGPYVTEVLPDDSKEKPHTASLFKTMSLDTVTLDDALRLLQLPRVVGVGAGRRGGRRAQRPLRAVRPEGQGVALARVGGAALHDRPARSARAARTAAAAARPGERRAAAARARHRPGRRQGDRAQGGPLRSVRHRRRDEREPAQGRRPGDGHARPRRRAARRAPREGSGRSEARVVARPPKNCLRKLRRPVGVLSSRTRTKRGIHLRGDSFERPDGRRRVSPQTGGNRRTSLLRYEGLLSSETQDERTEGALTQNQLNELLESEQIRAIVESAEERGFIDPAAIEAFAAELELNDAGSRGAHARARAHRARDRPAGRAAPGAPSAEAPKEAKEKPADAAPEPETPPSRSPAPPTACSSSSPTSAATSCSPRPRRSCSRSGSSAATPRRSGT